MVFAIRRFNSQGMILNGLQKNHFSEQVCGTRDPPPFMEKTILNFHFDYLNTSLTVICCAFAANNLYCAGASVLDTRPLLFCLQSCGKIFNNSLHHQVHPSPTYFVCYFEKKKTKKRKKSFQSSNKSPAQSRNLNMDCKVEQYFSLSTFLFTSS